MDGAPLPNHSPSKWRQYRRGQIPQYKYKTIREIKSSKNTKDIYNLYGVATDCRPCEKSKGSDFYCMLRIIDPSYCQESIKVTLFHQEEKLLPDISQWDIIRLHRVRANFYHGQLGLISTKGWSWVSWKGMINQTDDEIKKTAESGSATCTLASEDIEKVKSLRVWLSKNGYKTLDMARNAEKGVDTKISDIKPGSFFNLACQIAGITKIRNDFVILKVWDGTLPSYKIEPGAYSEDAETLILGSVDTIENFIVDVNVFDNHAVTLEDDDVSLGTFVRFCNLHASPKTLRPNIDENDSDTTIELFLHGGIAFNRGFVTLDDDDDTVVQLKKIMMPLVTNSPKQQKENSIENSPCNVSKKQLSTDNNCNSIPNKKRRTANDSPHASAASATDTDDYSTPQLRLQTPLLSKRSVDASTSQIQPSDTMQIQDTLDLILSLDSQRGQKDDNQRGRKDVGVQVEIPVSEVSNHDQDSLDMRCHQKSATAVFGDDSPLHVMSIPSVNDAYVPLRSSRLFRIRAKIIQCRYANDIVCHYCPVSGLRLSANNDGSKIKIPDDAFQRIQFWRNFNNLDDPPEAESSFSPDSCNVSHTQWPLSEENENGEPVNMDMSTYQCLKDGSTWQTMKRKKNCTIKRKHGRERFTIQYHEDFDCKVNLKSAGKNYNRIVRICSKETLLSQNIPPVCYQNGIYYYLSPACITTPNIPSLAEEAKFFKADKPLMALGCPVLPIMFHLVFLLEDEWGVMHATLKGQHAVAFFNEITPQEFILDVNQCRKLVTDNLSSIVNNQTKSEKVWAEMVVQKKSRRPFKPEDKPVILYEIVNTRIVQGEM